MNKNKKKKAIIFFISLVTALTGVFVFLFININSKSKIPLYSFSDNIYFENENGLTSVKAEDLLLFTGKYDFIKSDVCYNILGEKEKTLYKIYEYAFENCCTSFYIPKALISGLTYNDVEILQLLSLDSPLVEQNFVLKTSDYITEVKESSLPAVTVFAKEYSHYDVGIFSKDNMKGKEEALKKAEGILESVPAEQDLKGKAEYLYKALAVDVKYKNYSKAEEKICYLYDTFVTKETNCDGFTNGISLLFNLAGISCYEKAFYDTPSEKQKIYVLGSEKNEDNFRKYVTPTGHTWCCFNIDGKWYDADGTVDCKNKISERYVAEIFGFGVPAGYFDDYRDFAYKDVLPKTETEFLNNNDLTFNSVYDDDIVPLLYEKLCNNEKSIVRLSFNTASMDDLKDLAKRVCDTYDISVYFGRCDSTPVTVYYSIRKTK